MDRFRNGIRIYLFLALALAASILFRDISLAQDENTFCPEQAGFAVRFKDQISAYKVIGVFMLPGENLPLEAVTIDEAHPAREYVLESSAGVVTPRGPAAWTWQAPGEAALYPLIIRDVRDNEAVALNVFVMVPYNRLKGDAINGYKIGKYPDIPLKHLAIYKKPQGFIEVTRQNEDTYVSPHFTIKQFLCKQDDDYPKYVVLREQLLLKLELVLEKLNDAGYHCRSFHIMSGYRTPHYNREIGNVRYSRHVWGGAADLFVDEDQDGMMDDLNGDGKIDSHDAHVIYEIVDTMFTEPWYAHLLGGLARYKGSDHHGPFLHIDVRGFRAHWGS